MLGFARGELPLSHWPLVSGGKLHVDGTLFSNDIALLCEAAVSGLGIALLPHNLVSSHLKSGALVQVLAGVVGTEMQIALAYPARIHAASSARLYRGGR